MQNNSFLTAYRQVDFLQRHTQLLLQSYQHWTRVPLITPSADWVRDLMNFAYPIASHIAGDDPQFNYANRAALALFKMRDDEFLGMPSRYSAEPMLRAVPGGHLCGCGARGCFEQYASGNALLRHAREAIHASPDIAKNPLARGDGTIEGLTGRQITAAAQDGDTVAIAAFNTTGQWLGALCASLVAALDPEAFVIGGGVIDAGDILLTPTRESMHRLIPFTGKRPAPVIVPITPTPVVVINIYSNRLCVFSPAGVASIICLSIANTIGANIAIVVYISKYFSIAKVFLVFIAF